MVAVEISIHAPAKGATQKQYAELFSFAISIHAPAKGATLARRPDAAVLSDFNPRSREGSDVQHLRRLLSCSEFQSTLPRRERRHTHVSSVSNITISIHAPAKGATYRTYNVIHYSQHFNPRSREGSDLCGDILGLLVGISIHAPAKGATVVYDRVDASSGISIHAPAKGATTRWTIISITYIFQSTLPRRERPYSVICVIIISPFQSTLPRRERRVRFAPASS